jgi:hypothetical protein
MSSSKQTVDIFDVDAGMVTYLYIRTFIIMLGIFLVLSIFWGQYALFSIQDLSSQNANLFEGLGKVWFIFAWGVVVTLLAGIITSRMPRDYSPSYVLGHGIWVSLNAGVFEELIYRWLRFSVAMITLPFFNLITFGLLKWAYQTFLIPIADFATFGALHDYLFHPASWVIGAAIISANGSFRDGHEGNGWFSYVNSWFIGMVFFYLMFNYGLFTAIIAHVLYDVAIFVVSAFAMSWRPVARSYAWVNRSRNYSNIR